MRNRYLPKNGHKDNCILKNNFKKVYLEILFSFSVLNLETTRKICPGL